jgi:hypothetical protein
MLVLVLKRQMWISRITLAKTVIVLNGKWTLTS